MGQYRFTATTDRGVTTDFVMGYDPNTRQHVTICMEVPGEQTKDQSPRDTMATCYK